MDNVAYSPEVADNPNFISRPPDPGILSLFKTVGYDALYHSPFLSVQRSSELMLEQSPDFNVDGNTLSPEQAQKQYGLDGQLKFDEPIKESAANLMMRRKIGENDRDYVMGSGMTSGFRRGAGIGVSMAASLLDPINVGSMFIPVVGEARYAKMLEAFGGSVFKARLAQGAIQGAAGMAMVEPFIALPSMQEQGNYNLGDALEGLGYGAAIGGFLHAGIGAIGDHFRKLRPVERDAIFQEAMNNVLRDDPVTAPAKINELTENVLRRNAGQSVINERAVTRDPTLEEQMSSYTPLESVTSQDTNLQSLIGQNIEYSGYHGQLIRDEEGNFQLLRNITRDGKPNRVEIAGTGKDPGMRASDVGVFPEGTETRVSQIREQKLETLQQSMDDQGIRMKSRDDNLNRETKVDMSRYNTESPKSPGEPPKILNDITKEADDLHQQIFGGDKASPEGKAFNDQVKESIGDPGAREAGVRAGIECIVRNMI